MENTNLLKIKKLLALSKSSNMHEAELAAIRAAELMAKHQISEAELGAFDVDENQVGDFTVDKAKQITYWRARAAYAAAIAFGGELYANSDYENHIEDGQPKRRKRVRLQFVGREKDLPGVMYMYTYFCAEITRLADEGWERERMMPRPATLAFSTPTPKVRTWKDSFRKGCAARIYQRIQESREQTKKQGSSQALIKIDTFEKAAQDYVDKAATKTTGSGPSSVSAYQKGMEAGNQVTTGPGAGAIGTGHKQPGAGE